MEFIHKYSFNKTIGKLVSYTNVAFMKTTYKIPLWFHKPNIASIKTTYEMPGGFVYAFYTQILPQLFDLFFNCGQSISFFI